MHYDGQHDATSGCFRHASRPCEWNYFAVISNRVIFRVNVGFTYEADGISAMQCYAAIR